MNDAPSSMVSNNKLRRIQYTTTPHEPSFSSRVDIMHAVLSIPFRRRSVATAVVLVSLFSCGSSAFAQSEPKAIGTFVQEVARHRDRQFGLTTSPVEKVWVTPEGILKASTQGRLFQWKADRWQSIDTADDHPRAIGLDATLEIREVCEGPNGRRAAATSQGLFEQTANGAWEQVMVDDGLGRRWASSDVRCATYDRQGNLWFGTLAGLGRRCQGSWRFYTGTQGLPYNDLTCSSFSPDGSVWFGTTRGAIRWREDHFSYRQGPLWLPDDHIHDMTVDSQGNVILATNHGIGWIESRTMTLAEKAEYYEFEIDRFIRRTEYGYVSNAHLVSPGDKSQFEQHDNDNDGLWTAMYGAGECFAYAVDRSEISKRRADQAFRALQFLQKVTQDGSPSPPSGYVARSILPATGRDPNLGQAEHDLRVQASGDKLWKALSPRWPSSADGKWYWKSDTSSDELDGHYFFYALYYDLVAEGEAERQSVREVVRQLTDHLIEHHFTLVDHDGKPTRWGNFRPESLNHDFHWVAERGLNSLSMLAYLAVADHLLDDPRYARASESLRRDHSYSMNLMVPKIQRGIGSGNQSDDEMAFMSFYHLIQYTKDPSLRQQYLGAFHWYWSLEQPERNPFFHFAFAAQGKQQSFEDSHETYDLSPWGDWLEDSIDALKTFPLDRVQWAHTNSHRLDIVRLPPQQAISFLEINRGDRGYRVDGKVLPVDERSFAHWNTDPWKLDQGDSSHQLASGTVFLLPYHMGRFHRFITD